MRAISAVVGLVVLAAVAMPAQDSGRVKPSLLKATFSKLPIYFIENRGVYPDEVAYYVQGADKTLFFTREGITFRLKGQDRCWVVKLEFVGANPDVVLRSEDHQRAVFSYFKGPEEDWKTGLPTYARVVYEEIWPGVDLVYRGTVNRLKYEFVVKPGTDPQAIRLRWEGATAVEATESGGLRIETPSGSFEDAPPIAWQEVQGRRVPVETAIRRSRRSGEGGHEIGFRVGNYDRSRPLVLDPALLVYCGYIGGSSGDGGSGIAVDGVGNAYVTGSTNSDEKTFPVKVGPDLTWSGGSYDAFVAKVNAPGTALVYCGYIGGTGYDVARAIAVDAAGNAYVTGEACSDERTFPVKTGPDLTYNGGPSYHPSDGFVAKVNPSGTALVYCGYVGGALEDAAGGIAVDAGGNAFLTGYTDSNESSFPVKVGPDLTYNGGPYDAFVARVNVQGTALVYCGYIGGTGLDDASAIAVDSAGNAFVTGEATSDERSFPVTVGPDRTFNGGANDAFVAKVNAPGTALAYCGYVGGKRSDIGSGIAVDRAGNAILTGWTGSTEQDFPVRVGPDLTHNGGVDVFVAKVDAQGTALQYCGYIGGSGVDIDPRVAVDNAGHAYVTGATSSDEKTFPVKLGPDSTYNGYYLDAFVAKVDAQGAALVYCGYIGGSGTDEGRGIAVDAAGNAFVAGDTTSDETSFPVTIGPDTTSNGGTEAFVARVALTLLEGSGAARPGATVSLTLTGTDDAGLPYQLGTSFGTGPIPIDTRKLDLSPDPLLLVTVNNAWPGIFSGYRGVIDSKGKAQAAIHIPNIPALIGVRLHSAFVTLDPAAPSGIRSISNTFSFSVTK